MADGIAEIIAAELLSKLGPRIDESVERAIAKLREPLPLLDTEDLAKVLGVSGKTIQRLRAQNMPFVPVGDSVRFELDRVLAWFRARALAPEGLRAIEGGKR